MKFVGVDLAWGTRGGTGLCVAEQGKVLDSCLARTDEEIVERVMPYTRGRCLVAIDAPLIVRNKTGRRDCERILSRCFGRQHAAPHPTNLSLASFREGVRGERVARSLGLSIDPDFNPRRPVRAAIEVYPHPALVALFQLPVSIKYKAKRGRDLSHRKRAFAELIECLEQLRNGDPSLDVASPRWTYLRGQVEEAVTGAALDRAEDEIDAYVCAYVAMYYWTHGLERCRVVGDLETGYIVTPVDPEKAASIDAAVRAARASRTTSTALSTPRSSAQRSNEIAKPRTRAP